MNETPDQTAAPAQDPFEARLHAACNAVHSPVGLQQRLLQIPDLDIPDRHTADARLDPRAVTAEAANESQFLRRLLPAAAALLLAIGIGLFANFQGNCVWIVAIDDDDMFNFTMIDMQALMQFY
jgi:hypothetical protein